MRTIHAAICIRYRLYKDAPTAANATPAASKPSLGHVVAPALKPTREDDGDPLDSVLVGDGQPGGPVPTIYSISYWTACLIETVAVLTRAISS